MSIDHILSTPLSTLQVILFLTFTTTFWDRHYSYCPHFTNGKRKHREINTFLHSWLQQVVQPGFKSNDLIPAVTSTTTLVAGSQAPGHLDGGNSSWAVSGGGGQGGQFGWCVWFGVMKVRSKSSPGQWGPEGASASGPLSRLGRSLPVPFPGQRSWSEVHSY